MRLPRRAAAALAAAATVLTLAPGLVAPASAATGVIRGTVVGARGVDELVVSLLRLQDGQWEQVPGGFFDAAVQGGMPYSLQVQPGTYAVHVSAYHDDEAYLDEYWDDSYTLDAATPVTVGPTGDTRTANFTVDDGATISGTVVDDLGHPLAGAYLAALTTLDDEDSGSYAETDANGHYTLDHLYPDDYVVEASAGERWKDLLTEYYPNKPTRSGATTLDMATGNRTGIDFALDPASHITGRVTAPQGTSPTSATVEAFDATGESVALATPDDDGVYSLDGLRAGDYRVGFNMSSDDNPPFAPEWYRDVPETSGRLSAPEVSVADDDTTPGIDEAVVLGGKITGTVLDDQGRPVPDAAVTAYDRAGALVRHYSYTADDGSFVVHGLSNADYVVQVRTDTDERSTYSYFPDGARSEAAARTVPVRSAATVALGHVLVGDVKTLSSTLRPTVDGPRTLGALVTASPGTWSSAVSDYSYTWLRNGVPTGVTTSTYRVSPADVAQQISVRVGASRLGSIPGSATSDAVTIGRVTSRTALKAKGAKKRKATLTVTVSTPGLTPSGTVTIKDGSRTVRTVAVPAGGRVVLALKKLKPGKHTFTAAYSGSGTASGSSASAKTKVRR